MSSHALGAVLFAMALGACSASPRGSDAGSDVVAPRDGSAPDGTPVPDGAVDFDAFPPSDSAMTDAPGTVNGACSTLMDTAPAIVPATSSDPLPAPVGGTLTDGWYFLTASVTYGVIDFDAGGGTDADEGGDDDGAVDFDAVADAARDGAAVRGTRQQALMIVSGRVLYEIGHTGSDTDSTATYMLATTGAGITLNEVCPAVATSPIDGYDATGAMLSLHDSTARRIDTYTHQ